MVGSGSAVGVSPHHLVFASFCIKSEQQAQAVTVARSWSCSLFPASSSSSACTDKTPHQWHWQCFTNGTSRPRPLFCVPKPENNRKTQGEGEGEGPSASEQVELEWKLLTRGIRNSGIISSCLVGLLTGVAVVLFNSVVSKLAS